jgi:LTXXQ motif family protein
MRRLLCAAALVAALPLGAQMPGPGVEFLLARTGTLQLTDQQVVKLAAIARRAADRHKAMRASFDSLHAQFRRGDSAQRHREGPPSPFRAAMEKERDAMHTDLRDAIAVLTPDQQAHAWELISHRRMMMHHRGPRRGGPMMRDGHDGRGGRDGHGRTAMAPGDDDDDQVAVGDDQ